MKFHFVTTRHGAWQVHRLNCPNVEKIRRQWQTFSIDVAEAENSETLVRSKLTQQLMDAGYSKDDFRIMLCCKLPWLKDLGLRPPEKVI